MFLLFGFVLAVVMVPLLMVLLFAGLLGRAVARSSWRVIGAVAIAAVLLGFASGWHAALFAVVAVALEQSWRKRRSRRLPGRHEAPRLRRAPMPTLNPHSELETAWRRAASATRGDPRIAVARARCAALLARAEAEPADSDLADWAEEVERLVPELVDAAVAANADARDLAEALERIGAEADERVDARRRSARDRFTTLSSYVRSRTAGSREWL